MESTMTRENALQIGKLARARHWLRLAAVVLPVVLAGLLTVQTRAVAQSASVETFRPWTGDLDGMIERGAVRILVPLSATLFYQSKGENYGAEAELGIELEKVLNERYGGPSKKIKVVFMPAARSRLFEDLRNGRGDIAAANLTIIPERTAIV